MVKDKPFGILVHGGAGSDRDFSTGEQRKKMAKTLKDAAFEAFNVLKNSSSTSNGKNPNDIVKKTTTYYPTKAIDAVESAVVAMENSGLFDAGIKGSYLTMDGKIEMDAAIMDGRDLSAGAVGMVQNIRNPISLARLVMENTDHVMLAGEGALELAKAYNIKACNAEPTEENLQNYNRFLENAKRSGKEKIKEEYPKNHKYLKHITNNNEEGNHLGTVGAVAIDKDGNVASAVSTGGRAFKMPGRIGDSAIIGSGMYADNEAGATCMTGVGEYIMRICLAKTACDFLKIEDNENKVKSKTYNNAVVASSKAIEKLTSKFGRDTGGIISVDKHGNFAAYANTKSMPIAFISNITGKAEAGFSNGDFHTLFY